MSEHHSKWTIDKKIPMGVIFAIFVQSATIIWWVGSFQALTNERLSQHERRLIQTELFPERLASLETQSRLQTDLLRDIREDLRLDRNRVQSRNTVEDLREVRKPAPKAKAEDPGKWSLWK